MKIYSIFPSIDGEVNSYHQGVVSTFIRFSGCQLSCSYCDTRYALKISDGKEMSLDEIMEEVEKIGIRKITITGGEPLLQKDDFFHLTKRLWHDKYKFTVETNGSISLVGYGVSSWIVDYKLPSSGEYLSMKDEIFFDLRANDFVKFVIKNRNDYNTALDAMDKFRDKGCQAKFAFSPMFGEIDTEDLVNWMVEDRIDAILNLQLHKIIGLVEDK